MAIDASIAAQQEQEEKQKADEVRSAHRPETAPDRIASPDHDKLLTSLI